LELAAQSLDAVFTDPPYFGNVQYAELMDFCYVWLRRLAPDLPEFSAASTRNPQELTANVTARRGMDHFAEGLGQVFTKMAAALKTGAALAFTFHHNDIAAYHTLAVALLDARLVCSASLPCPAEMGASIHISGTGSSIIDTVFVCRGTGHTRRHWLAETPAALAAVVSEELDSLRQGGVKPTEGDARCMTFGHLTRLAIWHLREDWDAAAPTAAKFARVQKWLFAFGNAEAVLNVVRKAQALAPRQEGLMVYETGIYGEPEDEVAF
jgi:adenine-specific DNA methylase